LEFSCENRILIFSANHFYAIYFLTLVDIYLLSHIKSLLLYGGKLPPPRCRETWKNTVAGLRVNNSVRQFCTLNNIRWLETVEGNVNFTYHSDVNNHLSLNDHFLCSSHLVVQSKCTNILVDGDNKSDHMAISLVITTLEGLTYKPEKQPIVSRSMWDRVDPLTYQSTTSSGSSKISIPTEAQLCNTPGCIIDCRELENYYIDIVNCLSHAAEVCVPSVRVGVEKQ